MDEVHGIAILTALMPEFRAIHRAVGDQDGVTYHLMGLGAARVPQLQPTTVVIVAGLAGALDPKLRVGDLVLDTDIAGLPTELPWHCGAIHTTDRLVATVAEKAALFRETYALAVDMEQASVRRALPQATRVIGLRAISDGANFAIDPAVLRMIDGTGRPRPLGVLSTLVRRPGLIPHLRQLNVNSKLALRHLGLGVAALAKRLKSTC